MYASSNVNIVMMYIYINNNSRLCCMRYNRGFFSGLSGLVNSTYYIYELSLSLIALGIKVLRSIKLFQQGYSQVLPHVRSHTLIKRAETQREASSLFCFVIGSCLRLVGDTLQIQIIRHPSDTKNQTSFRYKELDILQIH